MLFYSNYIVEKEEGREKEEEIQEAPLRRANTRTWELNPGLACWRQELPPRVSSRLQWSTPKDAGGRNSALFQAHCHLSP